MREKMNHFLKNYQKAFIPAKNYISKELTSVEWVVKKKIAETNCRRIVAMTPIFCILYVWNVLLMLRLEKAEYLKESISVSVVLLGITVFTVGLISWIMYFNKVDNRQEIWKFKLIYRVFWPMWFVLMGIISLIQLKNGFIGIYLVISCIIVNLLPLHSKMEILADMALLGIFSVIMFIMKVDEMLLITRLGRTIFAAMLLIGYIAQYLQTLLWMSREYLYMEAFIDPLTELLNRRGGNAILAEEIEMVSAESEVGVIMFDIDYFKKYNDTFGHDAGDVCLKTVGKTIRETLEPRTRLMIRHGGEEFVAILFNTNDAELKEWAEKIRVAVYEKKMEAPVKDIADYVTVSIGISMEKMQTEQTRYEDFLKNADEALYEAKRSGRNRVATAGK